ncbi:MAG: SUF system Fe-S cluster assembly regulator [Planctomycetes bacterium]|nr:SUF system Fe-S cluster assembly regulator [Planctomycetota bacterium]
MIRISKQADYGILLLGHFAKEPEETVLSARELATRTHVAAPMASKVLKMLARSELLESVRGVHGGYRLKRGPEDITIGQIIVATDGPIAVTECSPEEFEVSDCTQEPWCPVSGSWQRLNDAIRGALDRVTLAEMTCPVADPVGSFAGHDDRADV